jgi:hypothetical protein
MVSFLNILASSVMIHLTVLAADQPHRKAACSTDVRVVDLKNYSFTAKSFLEPRRDLAFKEIDSTIKYKNWADDAVARVNHLFPKDSKLCDVEFKLIFDAQIKSPETQTIELVPISIIESYQEPKTNSVRQSRNAGDER